MAMKWSYTIIASKIDDKEARLKLRVYFGSNIVDFNIGLRVELSKWNTDAQRSKSNVTHGKRKVPANYINREIQKYIDTAERLFYQYEGENTIPTKTQFKKDFNVALQRTPDASDSIVKVLDRFMRAESAINQWGDGTIRHFSVLGRRMNTYSSNAELSDIDTSWLEGFVRFLVYDAKLSNATVRDYLKRLRWFLNWCVEHGERVPTDYKSFSPRLTVIRNPVIFLTWDELMTVYHAEMPTEYLERTRDLFCLSCFTSLRFSDVQSLKPENVTDDHIEIVTQKTSDALRIELNDYSREILRKYNNNLPKLSNQKMNKYIKEVGMVCGLNAPIMLSTMRAGKRVDTTSPKWRLMTTHTGRRTFICNALALGIPADVVMKWTGHKDYDAMRPYIDIADEVKRESMERFNVSK